MDRLCGWQLDTLRMLSPPLKSLVLAAYIYRVLRLYCCKLHRRKCLYPTHVLQEVYLNVIFRSQYSQWTNCTTHRSDFFARRQAKQ